MDKLLCNFGDNEKRRFAIPDEMGVIDSLANDGHTVPERIAEFIDNSIDAGAKKVNIFIKYEQKDQDSKKFATKEVIIADNGTGIVDYVIDGVLRLGDQAKKDLKKIGKYGIGLKSAAFGIGDTIKIITKTEKSEELSAWIYDLTDSSRSPWEYKRAEFTLEEANEFSRLCGRRGTMISVTNLRKPVSKELASISEKSDLLNKSLGRTFHKQIESKEINLTVNARELSSNSPHQGVKKIFYSKEIKTGVNLSVFEITDIGPSESDRGVYIYYGERLLNSEPLKKKEFGFEHATFNSLRVAVTIDNWESLQKLSGLNINNQKNGIRLDKSTTDLFKKEIQYGINCFRQENQIYNEFSADFNARKKDKTWLDVSKKLPRAKSGEVINGLLLTDFQILNEIKGKNPDEYESEVRLLNKMDSSKDIPKPLADLGVCPIRVNNHQSRIFPIKDCFIKFHPFDIKKAEIFNLSKKLKLRSLGVDDLTSEKKVINFLKYYNIYNVLLGETGPLVETISGMEKTGKFKIQIGSVPDVEINGVQVEIDLALESLKKLYLLEHKVVHGKNPNFDDITIRQIVHPHAHNEEKFRKSGEKIDVCSGVVFFYPDLRMIRYIPIIVNVKTGEYRSKPEKEKIIKIIK